MIPGQRPNAMNDVAVGTQTEPSVGLLSRGRLIGIGSAAALVCVWWISAEIVQAFTSRGEVLLPSPAQVVQSIPRLAVFAGGQSEQTYLNGTEVLLENSLSSAVTLIGGLLIGGAIGVGAGLAIGWSPRLRAIFEGPLLVIRVIPLLALLPLFLSWFGGTRAGSISYVAFAVASMLFINTVEAIRNVDPILLRYARTLGASNIRAYRTVVIPAIIPELTGGVRVVLGLGWAILLAAEFLAAQSGIGHIMILAQQYFDTSWMILIVVLIMFFSYVLDRIVARAGQRATRWTPRVVG